MGMLQVLDFTFWDFLFLAVIITILLRVGNNFHKIIVPKRPVTRPEAPANPSTRDHMHLVSGTIYEINDPEHGGFLPVRTELSRNPSDTDPTIQYFQHFREAFGGRSMAEVSNSIHESLNARQAAPGVVVRTMQEKEALSRHREKQEPKETEVIRKSRYQRDPVI